MIFEISDALFRSVLIKLPNTDTIRPVTRSVGPGPELTRSSLLERGQSSRSFGTTRIADAESLAGSARFRELIRVFVPDPTWIRRQSDTF